MRHLTIKRVLYRTLCIACLASAIAGFLRGQGGYEPFLAVALFCAHAAGDVRLSTVTRCAAAALNFALGTSAKQEGSPPRRRK